jgi:hypothetical protein
MSLKRRKDKKVDIERKKVDKIDNNFAEKNLENNMQKKKLNKGKKIIVVAILLFQKIYIINMY